MIINFGTVYKKKPRETGSGQCGGNWRFQQLFCSWFRDALGQQGRNVIFVWVFSWSLQFLPPFWPSRAMAFSNSRYPFSLGKNFLASLSSSESSSFFLAASSTFADPSFFENFSYGWVFPAFLGVMLFLLVSLLPPFSPLAMSPHSGSSESATHT